jgi:hypothetical protein
MSYNAWQARFQGQNPLGRTVVLNGIALTVVGVAPKHFLGVDAFFGPDFWIPATMGESIPPTQLKQSLNDHSKHLFQITARLRRGVSVAAAGPPMEALSVAVDRESGDASDAGRIAVRGLKEELSQGGSGGGLVMGSMCCWRSWH